MAAAGFLRVFLKHGLIPSRSGTPPQSHAMPAVILLPALPEKEEKERKGKEREKKKTTKEKVHSHGGAARPPRLPLPLGPPPPPSAAREEPVVAAGQSLPLMSKFLSELLPLGG